MKLLVFDTSNSTCCAGLYEMEFGGSVREIAYEVSMEKRTHSEVLLPLIDKVLKKAEVTNKDVDLYGVTVGPGSFTGIRIGIATVKGMALVTGKKVAGVSSTEALGRSVEPVAYDGTTYILPCFDARNKRVFAGLYDEKMNPIVEENAYDTADLASRIEIGPGSRIIVCGNGAGVMIEALGNRSGVMIENAEGAFITPMGIARCVAEGGEAIVEDAITISPKYCARSQAERFKKPSEVTIEDMKEEDVNKVSILEAEGIAHPWTLDELKDLVTNDKKVAVVARTNEGEVVGYCGASFVMDEAEVGNLCVAGKYRREGIAKKVMAGVFERLKKEGVKTLFLEVNRENMPALKLYEMLGFETYGSRKDYYGQGQDALLLKIEL